MVLHKNNLTSSTFNQEIFYAQKISKFIKNMLLECSFHNSLFEKWIRNFPNLFSILQNLFELDGDEQQPEQQQQQRNRVKKFLI
jgi:hypothetical protein